MAMIKMRPSIDVTVLQPFFPEISRLVGHADAEVQFEASRVLVAMTDAGHILPVFQHFDTGTVALLLKSPDERTHSMGTRILQNFVRSADAEIIERLMSCDDCASQALKLLKERTTVDCSNLLDPTRVVTKSFSYPVHLVCGSGSSLKVDIKAILVSPTAAQPSMQTELETLIAQCSLTLSLSLGNVDTFFVPSRLGECVANVLLMCC